MHYKKRIESRDMDHFQQGGSNIHIGSPKPYTVGNLPGVNFNPLTLTNAPIEIDTTSFLDRINQMERLKFQREELAYKYKALESKEAGDQLDFVKSIMNISFKAKQDGAAAGGMSNLSPYFSAKQAEWNGKINDATQRLIKGMPNKDFSAFTELQNIHNDPEYLKFQTHKKIIDSIFDPKKDRGLGEVRLMRSAMNVLNNPNPSDNDISNLAAEAQIAEGVKISSQDAGKYFDNFREAFFRNSNETEDVVEMDPASGTLKTRKQKVYPSLDKYTEALILNTTTDPIGQQILYSMGFNPFNIDPAGKKYLQDVAKSHQSAYKNSFSEKVEPMSSKLIPDPYGDGDGGGKKSDSQKTIDDIETYLRKTYGDSTANEYIKSPRAYGNTIEEVVKNMKLSGDGANGGSASSATADEVKQFTSGFANVAMKQEGDLLLVAVPTDSEAETQIYEKYRDSLADKGGKESKLDDYEVRNIMGLGGTFSAWSENRTGKDSEFNTPPLSNDTTIFRIKIKKGGSTSGTTPAQGTMTNKINLQPQDTQTRGGVPTVSQTEVDRILNQ